MQTPAQVLETLDSMGEPAVREKLESGYFGAKKVPLVEGWLEQKHAEREREKERVRQAAERARPRPERDRTVALALQTREAQDSASKAYFMALTAVIVAGFGFVLSIVGLFVALR